MSDEFTTDDATHEPTTDDSNDARPASGPTRGDSTADRGDPTASIDCRDYLKRTAAAGVAARIPGRSPRGPSLPDGVAADRGRSARGVHDALREGSHGRP